MMPTTTAESAAPTSATSAASPTPSPTGSSRSSRRGTNEARRRRTAELFEQIRETSADERAAMLEEIVVLNIPVAKSLASRYRNRGQPMDELEQVACLALVKVVRNYHPDRGEDLLVLAVPSILGELKRYFRDSTWAIRPPRRLQELRPRVMVADEELGQQLGRPPTAAEIAAHLGSDLDDVIEAIECRECATPMSLDQPATVDADSSVGDRLPEWDSGFAQSEAVALLGPACRRLKPRDKTIVQMRFYEQLTQSQIADRLGVTQVQVSRLLQRIMRDLRDDIGEVDLRSLAAA